MRRREEQTRRTADRTAFVDDAAADFDTAFNAYLRQEAKEEFDALVRQIFGQLTTTGRDAHDAQFTAERLARAHFTNRFQAKRRF